MNKDIRKYIAQCALCYREKAKVQVYVKVYDVEYGIEWLLDAL